MAGVWEFAATCVCLERLRTSRRRYKTCAADGSRTSRKSRQYTPPTANLSKSIDHEQRIQKPSAAITIITIIITITAASVKSVGIGVGIGVGVVVGTLQGTRPGGKAPVAKRTRTLGRG